ncbi:hypothetical protein Dimus_025381 [Dionaea muscipula]
MASMEENSGRLEWRMDMPDGTSKVLQPEPPLVRRTWMRLKGLLVGLAMPVWRFLVKSWSIGVDEPMKFIHGLKVAVSLTVVSLFYYMRPLYDGVGGNAMWAILTVVVVSEYTVGATLYKSINRGVATVAGGTLGIGIDWIATQSGEKFEPIILGTSVFILAAVVTFSRFIPSVKKRFDYGATIFILTFSLVSLSGYRVDKLWMLAHQRVSTIAIGASLCILVSMLFYPVWAGDKLHQQTISNLEKLANSLEGHVAEYFNDEEMSTPEAEKIDKKLQEYKCVLNSKATEETMINYAIWEPAHGSFTFGYPWKQYVKIGAAARNCGYSIDSIRSCINSEMQAPAFLRKHIKEECMKLGTYSSVVLKELASMIKTMRKSTKIDLSVGEMNFAVQQLHNTIKTLPGHFPAQKSLPQVVVEETAKSSITEILPVAALVILLTETVTRIEEIVDQVNKLASLAEFETNGENKFEQEDQPSVANQDPQAMKIPQSIKVLDLVPEGKC